jgi:benzoyl-CoA reductase subunit BamC
MANTRTVKRIKVDADKCNGCRSCEIICSAFHAKPAYSSINPARSRIQIVRYPLRDVWLPIFAGEYTKAECSGRETYVIDGKEYEECDFCRASCPSRDRFKEPDSGLPLKCDMCEGEEMPLCVKWCLNDVLVYEEREEEYTKPVVMQEEVELGLQSLVDRYGLKKVSEMVGKMGSR